MGAHIRARDLDVWTEQVGEGPDVLLVGGAGDTVESWQFQLDGLAGRYLAKILDPDSIAAATAPKKRTRKKAS